MSEFKKFHPFVNLIYFVFVIGFSCFFMHPVCLLVSFLGSVSDYLAIKGKYGVKTLVLYIIPIIIIMAFINPLFNHRGATVLTYFPNGNPLTLESVIYGIASAFMIISVVIWFFIFSDIMTSDKFIYLFGRIIPSLSLVISMTLRFVPLFINKFKEVINARRCMGRGISEGDIIKKTKNVLSVISVMMSWALESSVDTADSMKSRGYGLKGRTAFSIFKFSKRDLAALLAIFILGLTLILCGVSGLLDYTYFPYFKVKICKVKSIAAFAVYFILCIFPLLIELWEVRKWNALKSKI